MHGAPASRGGSHDGPVHRRCIESLAVASGTELSDIERPKRVGRLRPRTGRQGARGGNEPKEFSAMNAHVACDLRLSKILYHFWLRSSDQ